LMLGGFLAAVGFLFACLLHSSRVGFVVALTIAIVVTNGNVCGSMLPLVFRRLGMDPAMMSNPLIAAISDILGVLVYYSVAIAILGWPT
jgi:magnesium transporter